MGLFDVFKGKKDVPEGPITLGAVCTGTFVPMAEIPDDVFAQGVLGPCCGIDPTEGMVYAPFDCKVTNVPNTLHAVGLEGSGIEVLIHVGVDTVSMDGNGFVSKIKEGSYVKKGQLLLSMDLEKIKAAGHPAVVITVVTNSDDCASVELVASGSVKTGDSLFQISK